MLVPEQQDPRRHEGRHGGRGGRALLRAPRRRLPGRRPRHGREPPRRRHRPGRLHHHRAVRQERLRRQRAHATRARSARRCSPGSSRTGGARTRSSPSTSTRCTTAPAPTASRRRRAPTSTSTPRQLNLKQAALLAALPKFPSPVLPDHRQEDGHGAAQQGAPAHGRPGLHHAGSAPTRSWPASSSVYKHPPNLNNEHGRLLHRLRHAHAHQALRLAPGVRGRPQGVHEHRHGVAAGGHRRHQEHHRAAELRLQAFGGPRRHRPHDRLHPHHGRRPRLQEAEVQPRLAGQAPAGLVDEALRARRRGRAGHEPRHHLLHVQEPDHHPDGRLRRALGRQRRRPRRPGERRRPPPPSPTTSCSRSSASTSAPRTPWTSRTGWASPARSTRCPSITLGTSGVTPLEMADAYATLRQRRHPPPAAGDRQGRAARTARVDWKPKTTGNRAIPAGVASVVTQCLERVASGGTGSPTGAYFPYPRAGKTGTTENGWDVWYVRLHAAARRRRVDGRRREELAHGRRLRRHLLRADVGQVLRRRAQGRSRTRASRLSPWTFSPWKGKMQAARRRRRRRRPGSASPSPRPTKTIKPTPTPTPKPTTPKPDADRRRSRHRRRRRRPRRPATPPAVGSAGGRRPRRRRRPATGDGSRRAAAGRRLGRSGSPRLVGRVEPAAALTRSRSARSPCGTP